VRLSDQPPAHDTLLQLSRHATHHGVRRFDMWGGT
jgi:hypothetical protein